MCICTLLYICICAFVHSAISFLEFVNFPPKISRNSANKGAVTFDYVSWSPLQLLQADIFYFKINVPLW